MQELYMKGDTKWLEKLLKNPLKRVYVKWPLNTSLYSIDTHGNNLTYLKYMVEAFDVSRFSNGTGVPTLNRNDIHKEMIPLVDISEQEAFEVIAHQADKSGSVGLKSGLNFAKLLIHR